MLFQTTPPQDDDEQVEFWISYSDLMAGLLLVFILLLIATLQISKASIEDQQSKLDKREQELRATDSKLKTLNSNIADILGVRVALLQRLRERFSASGGQISFDDATGAVRLGSNILFDEGSAELSEEGKRTLQKTLPLYYEALLGDPKLREHVDQIVFEGHTNSNYSGKEDAATAYLFNLRLSQARAYAAMEHVIKADISPEYRAGNLLTANGYSSSRLLHTRTPQGEEVEDKVRSRRLELRFRLKDEAALARLKHMFESRQSELKQQEKPRAQDGVSTP